MTTTVARPSSGLHGIVPPLATPLRDRDALDVGGLERLIEHVIAGGVHGIFVLGTTGEAPSLSYALRREVIDRTCRQVAGRVPVVVGVTDTSFVESVRLAQHAAESGAQAVVMTTPYYFPAGQPELIEYVQQIVPELPLPLYLYNMPMMTKVQFEPATLEQLVQIEKIVGIKDSSGDMEYFRRVLRIAGQRQDWSVLVGPEHLTAEAVRLGAHGGVNGGANVWPSLFAKLYDAAVAGDGGRVAELQAQVESFGRIYRVGRHVSAVIKGIKCSLSLLGVCSDRMAEPFARFRDPEREKVAAILRELGLV